MSSITPPGSSISAGDPWMQIVLFDLSNPRRINDEDVIWHPSDVLKGHILINAKAEIDFDDIKISFEGISRVRMTVFSECDNQTFIARSEQKFLTQKQELNIFAIQRLKTSVEKFGTGYRIPYRFVIPKYIIGTNPRIPEHCLRLPPSLIAGPTISNDASISYRLHVIAKLLVQGRTEKETLIVSEPVTVTSLSEELPPLETQDFPAEYIQAVSNPIRTSIIGALLGTMTISTQEPPALSCNLTASGGSTFLTFQAEVDAGHNGEIHRRLRAVSFMVEGVIRMKTFRSTAPFPKLPGQGLVTSGGKIRLSDQILKLETRTIGACVWRYLPDRGVVSTTSQDKSPTKSASASKPFPIDKLMFLLRSMSMSEPSVGPRSKGTWRTNFKIPIHITSRLTPTFCSPLIARSYSLVLRLKTSKICSKPFKLEIPIQVVSLAQDQTQLFEGPSPPSDRARPPLVADMPRDRPYFRTDRSDLETEEIPPLYNAQ